MSENARHIPDDIVRLYETHEWNHASAILAKDFPQEWEDLLWVLRGFKLLQSDVIKDGGRKSPIATKIDEAFASKGWKAQKFKTQVKIDEITHDSPTHEVDNFKNRIAVETEWNNKDPFYDRDLNNFRLLHQLGVISVGVIITRCDNLQQVFNELGKKDSYGQSTTHLSKLIPRLEGGGAGGCPVLVLGIGTMNYHKDLSQEQLDKVIKERESRREQRQSRLRL
jgi:hypothetical protein